MLGANTENVSFLVMLILISLVITSRSGETLGDILLSTNIAVLVVKKIFQILAVFGLKISYTDPFLSSTVVIPYLSIFLGCYFRYCPQSRKNEIFLSLLQSDCPKHHGIKQ